MEPANRVLFVDDEYTLRLTFPLILKMHGFEVRTAATVAQALSEITTHPFDILISDLNIGEAGDGFTVVSAMRRTQPECINFILTGFPAFESALAAIQRQVDDYLVKPAKVEHLVGLIQKRLVDRNPHRIPQMKRLSALLRETVDEILENALSQMKSDPVLSAIEMSDEKRLNVLPTILFDVADYLDSVDPDAAGTISTEPSQEYGTKRLLSGFRISMLVRETAILDSVVFDIVRQNLLLLDTSNLMVDLKRFNRALQNHLERSIQAYWDETMKPRGMERKVG